MNMMINRNLIWPAFTAVIIAWGVTAYTYINTGFSIAMIAFAAFVIFDQHKKAYLPDFRIDKKLVWAFGILYGAIFFTTLFHLDHLKNLSGGYYSAAGLLMYTIPFWMVLYIGRKYDIRKAVVYTFYAVVFAACAYGLIKYLMLGGYAITSFYGPRTRLAMMLDMFFPFTIAAAVYYRKNRLFLGIALVLILLEVISLVFGKVRGTYLAFSIALVIMFGVWSKLQDFGMSRRIKRYAGLSVLMIVTVMVVYGVSLGWGNPHAMVGEERFLMWESSYHMWLDHPAVGIGMNDWQGLWADSEYTHPDAKEHGAVHPHNVFIYFFTTCGTIGGIAYLLYNGLLFSYLFQKIKKNASNPFNWAMMFMFVAVTAHGLVDQSFILKLTGRIFYFMLGYSIIFDEWDKCQKIETETNHEKMV